MSNCKTQKAPLGRSGLFSVGEKYRILGDRSMTVAPVTMRVASLMTVTPLTMRVANLHMLNRRLHYLKVCLRQYSKVMNLKPSKSSTPEVITMYRDPRVTEIIDVRTSEEFSQDHIPGAINLPVLSGTERATVGTLYSSNQFKARKVGAATVAKNISEHITEYFENKPQEYSPLIYCWRGGQRSYSMALILAQIGFQTFVLDGGYREYRRQVREQLSTRPELLDFKVISGLTGSGKTHILSALAARGEQVLDLEGLAQHKGSVLGLGKGDSQPSQKLWESRLAEALSNFTSDKPVWMESESQRIGFVTIPQSLFNVLRLAPRYCVNLPLEERVKHIIQSYPNWIEDTAALKAILKSLVRVRGHKMVNDWLELVEAGRWAEFVERILLEHYDPSYTLSQKKNNLSQKNVFHVDVPNLDSDSINRVVEQLVS